MSAAGKAPGNSHNKRINKKAIKYLLGVKETDRKVIVIVFFFLVLCPAERDFGFGAKRIAGMSHYSNAGYLFAL